MSKYLWDKNKIIKAVKNNYCYRDVLRELSIPVSGNNTTTLKRKIQQYNIDISHFTFRPSKRLSIKNVTIERYLNNEIKISSAKLKERLLNEGLKTNKCEKCGLSEWNGMPLVIQLHHIDGNRNNNSLDNLEMLCPNCHSQTENYCGNSNKQAKQKYYCPDCGREISKNATRCLSCASKFRGQTKFNLSKEELQSLLDQGYSRIQIGKKFGITEAAIRKWIKKYNI